MAALCPRPSSDGFGDLEIQKVIAGGSLDFEEWTSLISEIENLYPDDMKKICLVYDHFLSKFPLCYMYWRKYANHMARLCTIDKVVEVFERAVVSATYSINIWVDYCSFGMSAFEDPSDIRRLFKRAVSFVGKDYLCHTLWDKFIQFEYSQQQWISLAHIYIQILKFPTKKLHQYYDSFQKLVTFLEEGMKSHSNFTKEVQSEPSLDGDNDIPVCCKDDNSYCIVKDMLNSSAVLTRSIALKKYKNVGERLYHDACQLDSKIRSFEACIQRSYFHVRPLDASQLQNWHHYLDFVELQGDFDWAVKLYERCLIVCANYPEFWMRYVDFMETKGGREIANYSLDRATEIFLKTVPAIHLFNARFKEHIGDVLAARAAYIQSGTNTDLDFVENVMSKANVEKRLGNTEAAFNMYKEALELAAEEKLHIVPILYVHYSRLKYMSTNSVDAARDVLIDGIRNSPGSKLLLEELIKFSMVHGGPVHIAAIDSIIADAISPQSDESQGLSAKDAEDISNLYLQFVDYCGTIHDIRKAWNRHMKLFPDSFRTDIHKKSAKCRRPLNLHKDTVEEKSAVMPHQPSGDSCSDLNVQTPSQYKKVLSWKDHNSLSDAPNSGVSMLENFITQPDDAVTYKLQFMETDDSAQEKGQELPIRVSEEQKDNDFEQNVSSADLAAVKEATPEVSKHFRKQQSELDVSSENPVLEIANEEESLQASQAYSKENNADAEGKSETESDEVKPLSQESPSWKQREIKTVSMMHHECEAIHETRKSNGGSVGGGRNANQDNSGSTQDSESVRFQIETNSPSSSASHQDHIARRPFLQPRLSRNSGVNWHRMSNSGKFRRGPKYGYHGHGHRKQHQQRQLSSQHRLPERGGAQMPTTPGYLSQPVLQQGSQGQNQLQAPTNIDFVAASNWPMQNMQLQNPASQSQPPSQISQHTMQGGHGQYGHVQNGQAYNQMWQYYYYQQQQQFLLQQQLQPQQQLLLQEQYEQQLQHQQYIQLQQQTFPQDQSQQLQQQNQLERIQLQQQQQLLQQQHFQRQQEHPAYPQELQPLTQGQGEKVLQQSGEPGLVSSSIPAYTQEKSPEEIS